MKLENNEKIILESRKHWFIAFLHVFNFFISVTIPFALLLFLKNREAGPLILALGNDSLFKFFVASFFFCFIWALFMWMFLFINLLNYYLDVWYITSDKLVDIEQKGLFHRDEATLRLENIQDVAIVVKGIIQTLLVFGDIHVQTSGEKREFVMKNIANPEKVKQTISMEQDKVKTKTISVKIEDKQI